jgi:DNA-binding XRE family transcriptional regulator
LQIAKDKMNSPTPEQVKQSRTDAGLTQTEAAELIYKGCRAWQQYEKGDRAMDAAYWELFLIKTKQVHNAKLTSPPCDGL